MKSTLQLTSGISFTAILTVILLVTSPAIAVPSSMSLITTNNYDTTPNVELASVVGGIGQSVYASVYTFGGVDGSSIPVDTSLFNDASSWFIASLHQTGFESYVQRAPAPVSAPDGLSLHIKYPTSVSETGSINAAFLAAGSVQSTYGVTLSLTGLDLDNRAFMFWANNSGDAASELAVAEDVTDLGSTGFASVLDASDITSSPVFWSGYGARTLANADVVQFGAGWIDEDGLTNEGSNDEGTIYKASSANIFGGALTPNANTPTSLSRVTFTFPYAIAPVENGIIPMTTNPLPHVTGIATWDLRHPIGYGIGGQSDLSVSFNLQDNTQFPNIQNKFSIDQAKLTNEGTLEGTFEMTNTGEEAAENVQMYFPLGSDLSKIVNQDRTIYEIKDGYTLDTDFTVNFTLGATSVSSLGTTNLFDEQILSFSGWYLDSTNELADWNNTAGPFTVFDETVTRTVAGQTVQADVTITLSSNNGFPNFLIDLIENQLTPGIANVTELSDIEPRLRNVLPTMVDTALDATLETYYDEVNVFVLDEGEFELKSFEYHVSGDQTETFWWLYANISQIAVGQTVSRTFTINNIPTAQSNFQFLDFDFTSAANTAGDRLPEAVIQSELESWLSVMQYLFQAAGYDGRPLSYGYESSISFGLDTLDSYHSSNYLSPGAYVTFENTKGYPFFTLSNGQNLQIADDEAVVSAILSLDKQVYSPGEDKTVTVELENTGTIPAENIKVHLYHATLGNGFRFERTQKVTTLNVSSLAAGGSTTLTHTTPANSFVGYSPMYAYVEFDSDVGQENVQLRDYLGEGITEFEASGETHHVTFSNLDGALLLSGSAELTPTIKEPKVDITKTQGALNADNEFDLTYTLENTGEADTTVYFAQPYNTEELELVSSTDDRDAVKIADADYGYVYYSQIQLAQGETKTFTFTFKLLGDSATIWPAYAYFTIAGESTLGASVDTGASSSVGSATTTGLGLAAGSQAQEDSQKSANENGASSSYSASSSVGASVETGAGQQGTQTGEGVGFIGYDALGFLALMAVPLTVVTFLRRRR